MGVQSGASRAVFKTGDLIPCEKLRGLYCWRFSYHLLGFYNAGNLNVTLETVNVDTLLWIGICFCILQSAMFSGLNLAFFSLSRLQLELETKK